MIAALTALLWLLVATLGAAAVLTLAGLLYLAWLAFTTRGLS